VRLPILRRSGRRPQAGSGRLPDIGQDHERGHLEYVDKVGEGGVRWLRTKPFCAPPSYELARCLHSFGHIVDELELPVRAQALDVGCGPGWLSEFLCRCGYWVTGVDISQEMIEIARERVGAISSPIGPLGQEPIAEFHTLRVRELPWKSRFDAAILYDAMHHFDNELETLRVIRRSLVPGGRIYVHEGVRPEPGSAGERELIEEMERHGTLESPFDPEYLVAVVEEAGFEDVRRFVEVDRLVEIGDGSRSKLNETLVDAAERGSTQPETNTILATNPVSRGLRDEPGHNARIQPLGEWRREGEGLALRLSVANTGLVWWPASVEGDHRQGIVTVGPYLVRSDGARDELPRTLLPRPLAAGESTELDLRLPLGALVGANTVEVDLVHEGVVWFSERGSPTLSVPLPGP
jgi:SAM-dependent methyltransferase